MANIFDVAKYILEKQGPMDIWKLQKLCYYSQAWSIAWDDNPIFDEDFEAWSNGPVCPILFYAHNKKYIITADDLRYGNSVALNDTQKEDIDIVLRSYGDKKAYWLRGLTHHEVPWQQARGQLADGEECHNIIAKDAMGAYYASL